MSRYLFLKKYIDNVYKSICYNKDNSNNLIPYVINYISNSQEAIIWSRLFSTKKIFNILKTYLYHQKIKPTCLQEAALAFIILSKLDKKCRLYIGFHNIPVITFHAWVECEGIIFFEKRESMHIIQEYKSQNR